MHRSQFAGVIRRNSVDHPLKGNRVGVNYSTVCTELVHMRLAGVQQHQRNVGVIDFRA